MKIRIKTKWIVIFFIGVIFSCSFAAMQISGKYDLSQFYDAGTVYNYQSQSYNISSETVLYQPEKNELLVNSDEALISYWLETSNYKWNYIICDIRNLNRENITWDIEFVKTTGEITGKKEWTLQQGKNILALEDGEEFRLLNIYMHGQEGTSYTIGSMMFRDKLSTFSKKTYFLWSMFFAFVYSMIIFASSRYLKKHPQRFNWYQIVEGLQTVYIRIGNYGTNINLKPKYRSCYRKILFFLLFLVTLLFCNMEWYVQERGYKYMITICTILLLVIAFISVEKPLQRKNWKSPLMQAWLILWGMAIISDFIVDKFYFYVGWIMLFVFQFLYLVIQNMKRSYQMLDDFSAGMQGTFWLNVIFCILCRPENYGERYCGIYKNPNVFSFYLVTMLVLFLTELDKREKKKEKLVYTTGVFLIIWQLWLAQSLSSFAMVAAVMFFWILRRRMIAYRRKESMQFNIYYYIIIIALGFIAVALFNKGIHCIPQLLGTQVIFPKDYYQLEMPRYTWSEIIYAADGNAITNSRIYKKVFESFSLDSFTTGRNSIYLYYIQNMNLWGHYFKLNVAGAEVSAHNEILGIGYRYGVFAMIPYTAVLWYSGKTAFKRFCCNYKEDPYVFTILGLLLTGILKLLVDKFEQPFRSVGWLAFYLVIGYVMCGKETEERGKDEPFEEYLE